MKNKIALFAALVASTAAAQPALAQDATTGGGTTFRGIRVEANAGWDRFQSEGTNNEKFGYGGTLGFDGTIGERFVIGAEGSYWRANKWTENCSTAADTTNVCRKAFEEWGAAVRAGVLATPDLLIFAKGGYVNSEQRKRITTAAGAPLVYDTYRSDGYQVGGGAEYTLTQTSLPVYVNAQYVFSDYHGHSSRHRVMGGIGVRFK
ncbi:outer membrane protein [Novosphingobium sp. M1R2S20]|uniref:Outer membrane protein n=1 Tax=Novosphingobium rhizovicinum TaxID=3228928 RepID=A0ABV3R6F5_9SPHN